MARRLIASVSALAVGLALSGCYTVLQAPGGMASTTPVYSTAWESSESTDSRTDYPYEADVEPYGYGPYGSGFPVFGYDSTNDMYGFGSPFVDETYLKKRTPVMSMPSQEDTGCTCNRQH